MHLHAAGEVLLLRCMKIFIFDITYMKQQGASHSNLASTGRPWFDS